MAPDKSVAPARGTAPDLDLVGLTGWKQSGKNTAAQVLVDHLGFVPDAFADDLKGIVYDIRGISVRVPATVLSSDPRRPMHKPEQFLPYQEVVDRLGLDNAKELVPDVRLILQTFGTEAMRSRFGERVWSDRVMARVAARRAEPWPPRTAVTDVRFPDEADVLRSAGGLLIRVVRPGQVLPEGAHASEAAIASLEVDAEVVNDGSVALLHARVLEALVRLRGDEDGALGRLAARLRREAPDGL